MGNLITKQGRRFFCCCGRREQKVAFPPWSRMSPASVVDTREQTGARSGKIPHRKKTRAARAAGRLAQTQPMCVSERLCACEEHVSSCVTSVLRVQQHTHFHAHCASVRIPHARSFSRLGTPQAVLPSRFRTPAIDAPKARARCTASTRSACRARAPAGAAARAVDRRCGQRTAAQT